MASGTVSGADCMASGGVVSPCRRTVLGHLLIKNSKDPLGLPQMSIYGNLEHLENCKTPLLVPYLLLISWKLSLRTLVQTIFPHVSHTSPPLMA